MSEKDAILSKLPQVPEPYWRDSEMMSFPELSEDLTTDVVIVGGGITGITTAYLLVKQGFKVVLLEADQLINGTTGHTTAKITTQHDLIYDEFIQHLGVEKTKQYFQANQHAADFIKQLVKDENIECDLSSQDAYIYTNSKQEIDKLVKEYQAYEKLEMGGEYVDHIPLDINVKGAIVLRNQAQFHPVKYLRKLVQSIIENGGRIFEKTAAVNLDFGKEPVVKTRDGYTVKGKYVASCTHFPFHDNGFYFSRMYADRSYVLAVKTEKEYPGGMYLSAEDPKRSLRYAETDGDRYIIIGGESHKTGQDKDTLKHYLALAEFGEKTFGINEFKYRWSTQDLTTLDKVPYIGHITSGKQNVFVATGYRKWGMTNGTAAAHLIKDLIVNGSSPYEEVFSPTRFQADPSVKHFLTQNANVAKNLIEGKLEYVANRPEKLEKDEGAVVSFCGKRAGAYKDKDGQLHIVDTTCTHMGCEVEWNNGDRTWDCPCHGSRFSYDGEVIEGPAKKPLKKLE
ncbi:FAD-dependent oxidoreductase [Metabacillus arenae]|uniref:FAD-dependent oxidoreductase n=1 Tax=Metabacillus arenae TaxID=2771434 RepID=A0A926NHX7_9BACI|nr:FAD-dependent oxidoreductase [Metabacillus arenae]MBD1380863.1 FAD-dependent oxidoreductase [Metabacillus arenae]